MPLEVKSSQQFLEGLQEKEARLLTKLQEATRDRALVDRLQQGDQSAFEELVVCYWGRIYSAVNRLLRNTQDAEEVTQDTFIRVHRGLATFRGESTFFTWLYKITINLAHTRWSYWWRRRRHQTISFDQPVGSEDGATLAEIYPAEHATPDEVAVTQEFVDRVAQCLEKLSPKYRQILILRNVYYLAYSDIAMILGVNINTAKSRISRARESLRRKIGKEFL